MLIGGPPSHMTGAGRSQEVGAAIFGPATRSHHRSGDPGIQKKVKTSDRWESPNYSR